MCLFKGLIFGFVNKIVLLVFIIKILLDNVKWLVIGFIIYYLCCFILIGLILEIFYW